MTLNRFLTYIFYSLECPTGINPVRWHAMLLFAQSKYGVKL